MQFSNLSASDLKNFVKNILPKLSVNNKIGKEIQYANTNSYLVGKIIEKTSNLDLDIFLKKEIFEPLEMKRTFYNPPDNLKSQIPPTEILENGQIIQGVVHDESARYLGTPAGHAGLFSCINDLNSFLNLWINDGKYKEKQLLTKKTITEALKKQIIYNNTSIGLGWHIDDKNYLGTNHPKNTFFHPGFTGTIIAGSKSKKITVVFLSNCNYPERKDIDLKKAYFRKMFDLIFGI